MPQMLYYPGMTPPESALFQAVLYWDSVASIAPHEWRRYAERTERSRTLLRLAESGLYEPISLWGYPSALHSTFETELDRLLKHVSREDLVPPEEDPAADAVSNWYSVSRFPPAWTRLLLEEGLARARSADDQVTEVWVDTKLRHMIFAVAADHLVRAAAGKGATGPTRSTYTTDKEFFWAVNAPSANEGAGPCLEVDLGDLLPMPAPGTDLEKVIAFRTRYDDERRRVMHELRKMQFNLARYYGENPHEVMEGMRLELRDAIGDLDKAAKASKMTWVRSGVFAFVAVTAGAAATVLPMSEPFSWPLGLQVASWAALSMAGNATINLATNKIAATRADDEVYRYLQRTRDDFPHA
ncbi:hypothetical protein [Planotetraspora mira]|uniref:Uncharacterized protein n=2 Tax=Planotetraspora mira TaxID=58121 RepID=A0A8J3XBE4_9ACTN|nr:hypothetical protein Pmi06nite_75710 [Planotetraspora mira]